MTAQTGSFLTASWRNLVMLNYPVDPAILADRVPRGTELDFWNGETFVSLVGFRFLDTRLMGWKIPFHVNFDEVNLRFYVRHYHEGNCRRGVVFIREIVPRAAIALVARWAYNENYISLPMRSRIQLPDSSNNQIGSLEYSWKWRGSWAKISTTIDGEPTPLTPGSQEEFIAEHYWGYCTQKDGSTLEYQVEHPHWRVWKAGNPHFQGDIPSLYGQEFVPILTGPPASAFVAEGSEIRVRQGKPTRIK